MTRGDFFAKRTWYFQNFCSFLPKGQAPRKLRHRLKQLPSPGRALQTALPTQPSDTCVTVQAGCMVPGRTKHAMGLLCMPCLYPECPWPHSAMGRPTEGARKGWKGNSEDSRSQNVATCSHRFTYPFFTARPSGGGQPSLLA